VVKGQQPQEKKQLHFEGTLARCLVLSSSVNIMQIFLTLWQTLSKQIICMRHQNLMSMPAQ